MKKQLVPIRKTESTEYILVIDLPDPMQQEVISWAILNPIEPVKCSIGAITVRNFQQFLIETAKAKGK